MASPATAEKHDKQHSHTLKHLRRKTVIGILRTWREVKGTAREAIGAEIRPALPREDKDVLLTQMRDCLNPKGGEITARARTIDLGQTYLGLNDTGKQRFLTMLAEEFDLDEKKLQSKIDAIRNADTKTDRLKLEQELRDALTTPRSVILKQFSALPNGFKFLVDMRGDLVPLVGKVPVLRGLESDLKQILSSWFDIGFLDLVEITWNSPAALLEKLIEYEAVHKIRSWEDLKNRMDSDRRVYAFFHSKMPMEPLIFVQVALVEGMSDNVQVLLDEKSPVIDTDDADTAIFYSISNAQKGLAGISFGNFLIKRVVDKLSKELKGIKTYATLSPVPGFRAWLDPQLAKGDDKLFLAEESKSLKKIIKKKELAKGLLELLDTEWHKGKETQEVLKPILMRLCAHYLINEKKKAKGEEGKKPIDPVAQFHLFNGARLERINWLGDTSVKGMKQAAGLMVNYHYRLSKIDDNHEAFCEGEIVASKSVRAWL